MSAESEKRHVIEKRDVIPNRRKAAVRNLLFAVGLPEDFELSHHLFLWTLSRDMKQ
jgi:hypothetical protein